MHRLVLVAFLMSIAASIATADDLPSSENSSGRITPVISAESLEPQQRADEIFAKTLATKVDLHFVDVPLNEAVVRLTQRTGIPIRIDTRALADVALEPEAEVTISMEKVSLHSALYWMLKQHDLTFITEENGLLVTTPSEAELQGVIRFYAVPKLIGNPPDYDSLIEMITTIVEPDSWEELGGPGSVCPFTWETDCLVINQTAAIHEKIAATLAKIRSQHAGVDKEAFLAEMKRRNSEIYVRVQTLAVPDSLTPEKAQQLAQQIKEQVAPDSWKMEGTYVEVLNDRIIIRHRVTVQNEVIGYLRDRGLIPTIASGSCRPFNIPGFHYIPPQQSDAPQGIPPVPVPEMR